MGKQAQRWLAELEGKTLAQRYELRTPLGMGGMGAVFDAVHLGMGRRVAVKVMTPEAASYAVNVERFQQEARAAAMVSRRGVVEVLDFDRDPQVGPFLVMEFLEGESLATKLQREAPLPVGAACGYGVALLEVLSAVHARGIVHRDLKPGNVFLAREEGREVLKVLDFGISHVPDPSRARALTVPGMMLGTARFMAPEQTRDAASVDARADLYAVGAILYSMLAGVLPFKGLDPARVVEMLQSGQVPSLASVAPHIPAPLVAIVDRALRADRDQRFATADEMVAALRALLASASTQPGTDPRGLAPDVAFGAPPSPSPSNEPPTRALRPAGPAPRAASSAADTAATAPARRAPNGPPAASAALREPATAPEPLAHGPSPRPRRRAQLALVAAAAILALGGGVLALRFAVRGGDEAPTPSQQGASSPPSSATQATTAASASAGPVAPTAAAQATAATTASALAPALAAVAPDEFAAALLRQLSNGTAAPAALEVPPSLRQALADARAAQTGGRLADAQRGYLALWEQRVGYAAPAGSALSEVFHEAALASVELEAALLPLPSTTQTDGELRDAVGAYEAALGGLVMRAADAASLASPQRFPCDHLRVGATLERAAQRLSEVTPPSDGDDRALLARERAKLLQDARDAYRLAVDNGATPPDCAREARGHLAQLRTR